MESTLVLIKPDAVKRKVAGKIIDMIENYEGLEITKLKLMRLSKEKAIEHYAEHMGKAFFEDLIAFITSGSLYAMEVSGNNAVSKVRELCGKTDPAEAESWTIRAKYAESKQRNVVHSSDSLQSAERELKVFFEGFSD